MNKSIEPINDNQGITLLETLISIAVGSLITIMLIQILMLSIAARNQLAQTTRLTNESHVIALEIERRVETVQAQEIELIQDTTTLTEIEIRHIYDVTTTPEGVITRSYDNPVTDTLIFHKTEGRISYNGENLNDPTSVYILDVSSIEVIVVNPTTCNPSLGTCDYILKLTLVMEIVLPNGHKLDAQTYVSTILI